MTPPHGRINPNANTLRQQSFQAISQYAQLTLRPEPQVVIGYVARHAEDPFCERAQSGYALNGIEHPPLPRAARKLTEPLIEHHHGKRTLA